MTKLLTSTILFSILGLTSAHAQILKPDSDFATPAVKKFLALTEAKLAPSMKPLVQGPWTVDFTEMPGQLANLCKITEDGDNWSRASRLAFRKRFLLNKSLLTVINAGPGGEASCGGLTRYQRAQTLLLQQLVRAYDTSTALWNDQDKEAKRLCEATFETTKTDGGQPGVPLTQSCEYYLHTENIISDSLSYRAMADFPGLKNVSKNELQQRVSTSYELTSVQNHFAVNMANFLVDPAFQCHLPALNEFFSQLTKYKPFAADACEKVNYAYTSSAGWKIDFDPKKIYAIHFLFASKGQEISSRWGHAMLQLIVCAPDRKVPGPDCVKDVAYHTVISYRANIDDVIINNWDGLTGKYPSQLMLFSMMEMIEEYTRGQNRDLISVPLLLNEKQKNLIVQAALEHYWGYAGRYKFISNNCASEADQLLRAVLPRSHVYQSYYATTPLGMYKNLQTFKLVDAKMLANKAQAKRDGYFFPSQQERMDRTFAQMRKFFPEYKDMAELAKNSKAEYRRTVYEKLNSYDELGDAYLLEKYVSAVVGAEQGNVMFYLKAQKNSVSIELEKLVEKLVNSGQDRLPWAMSKGGYGVPLASQVLTDEQVAARYKDGAEQSNSYRNLLLQHAPELSNELAGIKQNLDLLTNKKDLGLKP